MINKILKIKALISLVILVGFSVSTMGAVVSDNDGSAFVTKAEFEALKENFSEQISNYNDSIDRKIDGAIGAYLSGIKLQDTEELEIDDWKTSIYFYNYPNWPISCYSASISKYYNSLSNWGAMIMNTRSELVVPSTKLRWSGWGSQYPIFGYGTSVGNWTGSLPMGFYPKIDCQDDANEYWYIQYSGSLIKPFGSVAYSYKERGWTQLWAVADFMGKISNVIYDLAPARGITYGPSFAYNRWNLTTKQPAWQLADLDGGITSQYSTGVVLKWNNVGNPYMFGVSGSRNDGRDGDGTWTWSIDEYQYLGNAALNFDSYHSAFGLSGVSFVWYISDYDRAGLNVKSAIYCDISNESVECVTPWGASSMNISYAGFRAFHWKTPGYVLSKLYGGGLYVNAKGSKQIYHGWITSWTSLMSSTYVNFGKPTSELYLRSMNNHLAAMNGVELGMMDGLPLFDVSIDGYVHLQLDVGVYDYTSRGVWSSTTNKSVYLHLNNSKFPYTPWYSTGLYLCDEEGGETTSVANSITPKAGTYSFDTYIPVKSDQTIYAKLQTNDVYGLTRVKIANVKATFQTD